MDKPTNFIFMVVFNPIQYDARVIRSAEAIKCLGENIILLSCNSSQGYNNNNFQSVVFTSKKKGPALLLSFWFYILKYALKNKKIIKLVYIHDYNIVFIGWIIAKFINVKWVYDAHELLIKRKNEKFNLREYLFILMEKFSITKADLVVAANDERRKILKHVFKLRNIISVRNIAPRSINLPNSIKEELIVYQGYMTEGRKVSYFIKLLEFLPPQIKLKLIGTGPDLNDYKELVVKLSLSGRVIFTGMIPYSQILEESKNCKLGIVFYNSFGLNNYYCSPNKIYEYAQLGIPMLVSPQPFLRRIVTKYCIGAVLEPNVAIVEHANLLLKLLDNYTLYQSGMEKFLADFTYDSEMKKLKEGISKIFS